LLQIKNTSDAYKELNPGIEIVNTFFAEAGDSNLFDSLRKNGIFVMDDNMTLLSPTN